MAEVRRAFVPARGGRGGLLGIRIGQAVVLELAAVVAVVGFVLGGRTRSVVVSAMAVVAVVTLARVHRRWLYEWVPMWLAFRRRRTRWFPHPDTDPQLAPLAELIPALSLGAGVGLKNASMGVVHDGVAWTVVVAVEPDDAHAGRVPPDTLPIGRLAELVTSGDLRLAGVQTLIQLVPAPSVFHSPEVDPCAASYRQLHPTEVPAARTALIALRLDPALCADALAARGGNIEVVHRALRRAAHRATDVLDEAGFRARVLPKAALQAALAGSAGVQLLAVPDQDWWTAETWRKQLSDGTAHVTFWLRDWPLRGIAELQRALCAVRALFTTMSLTITADDRAGPDTAAVTALVRVTTGPDEAAATAAELARTARAAGAVLVPLRGAQLPGLLATIPLGGGPLAAALRLPPHSVPANALEELAAPLGHGGLVVGVWPDSVPAIIPIFRETPTQVGVVGTEHVALLLAGRAIAVGARVDIVTVRPAMWAPLALAAPHDGGWVTIHPPGSETPPAGTSVRPSLVIDDVGDEAHEADGAHRGHGSRADLGAWQTALTLRRHLSAENAGTMSSYELVFLERVTAATARLARSALNLPDAQARMLPMVPDESVAVVTGGNLVVLRLAVTSVERALFPAPAPAGRLPTAWLNHPATAAVEISEGSWGPQATLGGGPA
jgi:type VII secretion protein EccE